MIRIILSSFLIGIAVLASGQARAQEYTSTNPKAEKAYEGALTAFDQRNHNLALNFLGEALSKDKNFIEAYLLRFEIYAELGQLPEAEVALEDAIRINPDFFPNAWFYLGTVEFNQGKYKEAEMHFERFLTYSNVNVEMAKKAEFDLLNCAFAIKAVKNPVDFEPKNMGPGINSAQPEYYPGISADNQYFIFTRLDNDPDAFRGKNENFYISKNLGDGWLPARPLSDVNTIFNEGAPTISADGRTMVFTACELMGEYGGEKTGFGSCDLFISRNTGGKWGKPENLGAPVNTPAWETQPSLSADGKTLYFVRGTPSSAGVKNQDIMVSLQRGNSKWSPPRPVSDKINTPGREESVMIHPDGRTLYFSSDGHIGMGGLDLYKAVKDDTGIWSDPVNLGYPINTHKDENSLLVASNGNIAFFASAREGGFGDLDLYSFELHEDARPLGVTYAHGIVTDSKSGKPLQASLRLYDVNSQAIAGMIESDSTDGTYLIALPTGRTYALNVSCKGYLYHSETFELTTPDQNEAFTLNVKLQPIEAGSAIVLKNIFFDLDEAILKDQSTPELQELGNFMKQNPRMIIELSGHTDNQGTEERNKTLSENRAAAVKTYLVEREAIAETRIKTKGMGAAEPIASNDTEEGRALNRRTEFAIVEGGK